MSESIPADESAAIPASAPETPAVIGGTDPLSVETPAPESNVVLENAEINPPAGSPESVLGTLDVPPALPGPEAFNLHGQPRGASSLPVPAERKGVYVDADGKSHPCKVVGKRKDGAFDLTIEATIGDIRIDAVQRKQDEAQVGGYIVI